MAGTGMEGAAAPQGGTTLLVIDDNPALQHAVRCLPAGEQLHCVLAGDSIEGLCCIVEHRPSVVLLDSEVAPLDAWRFALLVKEHPDYRHIRLVLAGNVVDDTLRARAEAVGIAAVLGKPFTTEELQQSLFPVRRAGARS
jgi:CheY-like chemotaxis protein